MREQEVDDMISHYQWLTAANIEMRSLLEKSEEEARDLDSRISEHTLMHKRKTGHPAFKVIEFDKEKFARLKSLYEEAKQKQKEFFMFDGNKMILINHAAYLIHYLTPKFR